MKVSPRDLAIAGVAAGALYLLLRAPAAKSAVAPPGGFSAVNPNPNPGPTAAPVGNPNYLAGPSTQYAVGNEVSVRDASGAEMVVRLTAVSPDGFVGDHVGTLQPLPGQTPEFSIRHFASTGSVAGVLSAIYRLLPKYTPPKQNKGP